MTTKLHELAFAEQLKKIHETTETDFFKKSGNLTIPLYDYDGSDLAKVINDDASLPYSATAAFAKMGATAKFYNIQINAKNKG